MYTYFQKFVRLQNRSASKIVPMLSVKRSFCKFQNVNSDKNKKEGRGHYKPQALPLAFK